MKKIITNNTYDYFVEVIQPKLDRIKVQDPFDDYSFKTLNYYNKNVWEVMQIPVIQSESERVARSRAFSQAKYKIFFNPDLRYFITLTYKENMQDYNKLKLDLQIFFKAEKRKGNNPKYLYTIEKQKRGALHVHMICNGFFTTKINKHGKITIPTWQKGFTNVQEIKVRDSKDADINFKPFLYMYKYMQKSQKVGGRYVHSSRNLSNFKTSDDPMIHKQFFTKKTFTEYSPMGSLDTYIKRNYYQDINSIGKI